MSTRNRLNEKEMCRLTGGLFTVLRNTVDYLDVPLTNKQMAEVWHTGLPTEIKEAYSLLDTAGYSQSIHSRVVVCHVPELKMLVRLMDRDQEQIFLIAPNDGPFKVKSFRTHQGLTRKVPLTDFETVLPRETYDDFLTWASAAAKCEERQIEARDTIDAIIKMLSTAGQLRRMVPELMQYLPADIQKSVADQQRSSPFPPEWASYSKDRVDRTLAALAEGHLFQGMAKRDSGRNQSWFSWATYYHAANP